MFLESKKRGYFLVCSGIDGSGKSTAAKYLVESLKNKDFEVYHTREPGGTVIAEKIRELILSKHDNEDMSAMTELLLFAAARAQHIEKVIKPKLDEGMVVVSDRFNMSTYAYQGIGRGYLTDVVAIENIVHKGFQPDCTLYFDVTLDESIRRLSLRSEISNRLDTEGIKFKARVAEGYSKYYEANKDRMYRIDAMQDITNVQAQIDAWVNKVLIQRRKHNDKYNY